MKDYKTVADDVFHRRDEIIEENKIRRKKLAEIGISAACWAAVGAVGFGVWKTQIDGKTINSQDVLSSTGQNAPDNMPGSEIVSSDSIISANEHAEASASDTKPIEANNSSDNVVFNSWLFPSEMFTDNGLYGDLVFDEMVKIHGRISNIDVEIEKTEYSPENGTVIIAESLKKAIEVYGAEDNNGELSYHVLVEYYKDGKPIEVTKDMWWSEHERGTDLNFESYSSDWGQTFKHGIWSFMTVEELESFEPSDEYGYVLHLYKAYYGYPYELMDNVINGSYNNGVFFG